MVKWLDVAFVTQCVMMCYDDVIQCVMMCYNVFKMSWEDVVTNSHKGWAQPTKGWHELN